MTFGKTSAIITKSLEAIGVCAAVAHLVERHLAKVEVASSSLVGRSNKQQRTGLSRLFAYYGDVAKW